jgi:hypothetical protein
MKFFAFFGEAYEKKTIALIKPVINQSAKSRKAKN